MIDHLFKLLIIGDSGKCIDLCEVYLIMKMCFYISRPDLQLTIKR